MKNLLLALPLLFTFPTAHAVQSLPTPKAAIEPFVLAPNQRTEYSNLYFHTLHASCVIATEALDGNDVFVEVMRKNGQINGKRLAQGEHTMLHLYNKDVLDIVADAAGRVALTNNGTTPITATCTIL